MTPTENWPKPWMLQLHEQAVEQGMIWVEGISEKDYASLKSRLYRIRRRGDKSMAAFIRPEYHLVMVGNWEEASGGRFPMIYNRKSDGSPLPSVRSASGAELETYLQLPPPKTVQPIVVNPADLEIKESDIAELVAGLKRSAKERTSQ